MTFVEFALTGGDRVYLNADRIDALLERTGFTEVFVGGADAPLDGRRRPRSCRRADPGGTVARHGTLTVSRLWGHFWSEESTGLPVQP